MVRTLLVGLCAFAVAAVAAAAPPPPLKGCDRLPTPPRGGVIRDTPQPEAVCGTRWADRIYVRGGDSVYAMQGNDTVYARNGKPDFIWGGRGRDRAYVDSCDSVYGVERVMRGRKQCRQLNP